MSLCLMLKMENSIIIGADTALTTKINGEKVRVSNEGKKIFQFGNEVMFCTGVLSYVNQLIPQVKMKDNRIDRDKLRETLDVLVPKEIRIAKGSGESMHLFIAICGVENGLSYLCYMNEENNFETEINQGKKDCIGFKAAGLDWETAERTLYKEFIATGYLAQLSIFNTYKRMANVSIGGNITVYSITQDGVKKILDNYDLHDGYEVHECVNDSLEEHLALSSVHAIITATSLTAQDNVNLYDTTKKLTRVALSTDYGDENDLSIGDGFKTVNIGGNDADVSIGGKGGETKFAVYTIDENATPVASFRAGTDSTSPFIRSIVTYNRTYSGSANVYITSSGTFGRSTSSSQRYKHDITDLDFSMVKGLYDVPVRTFKYNNDYLSSKDERYSKDIPGFIAEEIEAVLPIAVNHKYDGTAEMWNSNILIPCLLKLIQKNHEEIEELKKALALYGGEQSLNEKN